MQIVEGPHTRHQITSDGGSKRDSLDCVLCIPFILSGCLNECWLRTCHAISQKITRLQLRWSCSEGGIWEREFALLSLPLANEVAVISVATFRNYDGDGNGNRNDKNTIGFMMKTLHLQHAFCTFLCCPCTTKTWNDQILSRLETGNGRAINFTISLSLKSDAVPYLQFQPITSLLSSNDIRAEKFQRTRSLFSATFLLASPLLNRKATCKRTQQFPPLLGQQCWELLGPCWQWCPNGCNNFQQSWDQLQCIVGRIQPMRLCKLQFGSHLSAYVAPTMDPTFLHYLSAITEQKKCWELKAQTFDRFQTLRNNFQQATTCNRVCKRTQHVTSNNVGSCWPTMLRPFVRGWRSLFFVWQRGTTTAYIIR